MSVDEITCDLCGVAFDINRTPGVTEPLPRGCAPRSPWCRSTDRWRQWAAGCGRSSGCMIAFHEYRVFEEDRGVHVPYIDEEWACNLQYKKIMEEAQLHPDTALPDLDLDLEDVPSVHSGSEFIRVMGAGQEVELVYIGDYDFWHNNNMEEVIRKRSVMEGHIFGHHGGDEEAFTPGTFEHVAGPGCRDLGDYAAWKISLRDATRCDIAQAITLREPAYRQQQTACSHDDEDWERRPEAQWTLSGLGRHLNDSVGVGTFYREFDTVLEPRDYITYNRKHVLSTTMVFHPTCLEVFKRVAIKRYGKYDINQLGKWYSATGDFTRYRFPRHPAAQRSVATERSWKLRAYDAWVAANPCYVNRLDSVIQEAVFSKATPERPSHLMSRFVLHKDTGTASDTRTSLHQSLPAELLWQIFDSLPIETVANVALAYTGLTNIVHGYLIRRVGSECPWLWELWCSEPYSKWTTVDIGELKRINVDVTRMERCLDVPPAAVIERSASSDNPSKIYHDISDGSGFVPQPPLTFDPDKNDSYNFIQLVSKLFTAMEDGTLNGLKNRQRIWDDCELILDQIETLENYTDGNWDAKASPVKDQETLHMSRVFEEVLYGHTVSEKELHARTTRLVDA